MLISSRCQVSTRLLCCEVEEEESPLERTHSRTHHLESVILKVDFNKFGEISGVHLLYISVLKLPYFKIDEKL